MNRNRNRLLFNLQRFAAPNTQTTTTEDLSAEMKTFYNKTLLDEAEAELVHDQFADKYPIPKNGGKRIEFRKYDSFPKALTPLTEGVTPDGRNMKVTTLEAEIAQYGDYVTLSDVYSLTAIDNNVVQATKLCGSQSGRTLDTVTREVMNGGTNVLYAPKSDGTVITSRATLDSTCVLTKDLIMRAAAILKAANTKKIDKSYVAIIHPYMEYELMKEPEFIDVVKYQAADRIFEGEIGKIGGVRFVTASEAKIFTGDGCPDGMAVFSTIVLGAHAYAVTEIEGKGLENIIKPFGAGEDPLNQRGTVGWKALKTAERLAEQYMVRIESCGTFSASAKAN